jgi:microcystin degradation protein MlrC
MRLYAASLATETNTFSPIATSRVSFELNGEREQTERACDQQART